MARKGASMSIDKELKNVFQSMSEDTAPPWMWEKIRHRIVEKAETKAEQPGWLAQLIQPMTWLRYSWVPATAMVFMLMITINDQQVKYQELNNFIYDQVTEIYSTDNVVADTESSEPADSEWTLLEDYISM